MKTEIEAARERVKQIETAWGKAVNAWRDSPEVTQMVFKMWTAYDEARLELERLLAAETRASLASFEEGWNAPGMEKYDENA